MKKSELTKLELATECAHASAHRRFPHVAERVERQANPRAKLDVEDAPHRERRQRTEIHEHRVVARPEELQQIDVTIAANHGYKGGDQKKFNAECISQSLLLVEIPHKSADQFKTQSLSPSISRPSSPPPHSSQKRQLSNLI